MLWKKLFRCAEVLIICLVLTSGCRQSDSDDTEPVVFWIDNIPVTSDQFMDAFRIKIKTWGFEGDLTQEDYARVIDSCVKDLVVERVIRLKAEEMGLIPGASDSDVSNELERSYPEGFTFMGDAEKDWWNRVHSGFDLINLAGQIAENLDTNITITEEMLHEEYLERQNFYTVPGSLECQIIRVRDIDLANEIHAKLSKKWKFESLAKNHSDLTGDGQQGEIVHKSIGEFPSEMEPELLKLKPGNFSPVLISQDGYFIYKLVKEHPSVILPFEQVRDKLLQEMIREKRTLSYQLWLQDEIPKVAVKQGTPLPVWGEFNDTDSDDSQ